IRACQFRPCTGILGRASCCRPAVNRRPRLRTGNTCHDTYGTGDTMHKSSVALILATLGSATLAGCSGGSILPSSLTTQSSSGSAATNARTAAVTAAKVDRACYTLAQRIEMLRRDGVTERNEQASHGKSSSVSVKRTSLAQVAELDKANA